jgi:hypothetical protein
MILRYKRILDWYYHLRYQGWCLGVTHTGPWYSRYSKINCFIWAWYNSRTHSINGKYL